MGSSRQIMEQKPNHVLTLDSLDSRFRTCSRSGSLLNKGATPGVYGYAINQISGVLTLIQASPFAASTQPNSASEIEIPQLVIPDPRI